MGRRHEKTFLQRHTNGQQMHEKIFNITVQGNVNQNHNEISRYTYQNG